jgi:hypothetical protein
MIEIEKDCSLIPNRASRTIPTKALTFAIAVDWQGVIGWFSPTKCPEDQGLEININ